MIYFAHHDVVSAFPVHTMLSRFVLNMLGCDCKECPISTIQGAMLLVMCDALYIAEVSYVYGAAMVIHHSLFF